jgi:hypothetical protein
MRKGTHDGGPHHTTGVKSTYVGTVWGMPQATDSAEDVRSAVPAPRSKDAPRSKEDPRSGDEQPPPVDPEMFNFADLEHVEVTQAELDAQAASWDGFL